MQIARLFGIEVGNAFVQTFVRVSEQVHSNLLEQHLATGSGVVAEHRSRRSRASFTDRPSGADATSQALGTIGALVQREAYVLAYIDTFWVIAWGLAASLLLILLLRPPPPNPLTPPRKAV